MAFFRAATALAGLAFTVLLGVSAANAVEAVNVRLDDGLADMLSDLQRLTQANMAEEIDRFLTALQADLILPEDF